MYLESGACVPNSLEITTSGWPGPNEGTTIAGNGDIWTGNYIPIYYFIGYAYSEGIIRIGINPQTEESRFGNCNEPSISWDIEEHGVMGIFTFGAYSCPDDDPTSSGPRACCVDDVCFRVEIEECIELGGEFLVEIESCDPNPCEQHSPITYPSWGLLKSLYQ